MAGTSRQTELFSKLVKLAGGDVRLVRKAIRHSAHGRDEADLDEVRAFITRHRAQSAPDEQAAGA
jgi:hypothetical protein